LLDVAGFISVSPGLKPDLVAGRNVRAEARTYLRSDGKGKGKGKNVGR
jgi:hypothetical protein